ncbi:MAG: L-serine ammonia-lyase [Microbacteriaceae bacterium]|nr:L-serine ammonia-lyase [Microbacteriaceae bacterium]
MVSNLTAIDLFTVGIGPSSSHTVGPMRAARRFVSELSETEHLGSVARIRISLFGSLGATGVGHGTTNAIVAGLAGADPRTCDPVMVSTAWSDAVASRHISVAGLELPFDAEDIELRPMTRLPQHSNAMTYVALGADGETLFSRTYFSVGGGFIESDDEIGDTPASSADAALPFPFDSGDELIALCESTGKTIAEIAFDNAAAVYGAGDVEAKLRDIWSVMTNCVDAGLKNEGMLPGNLNVERRAAGLAERLVAQESADAPTEFANEWLQAFAIAVNEENAAGMRVVTAPTNGAAGIIPAVGYFAERFKYVDRAAIERDFLLTAGAIGTLYNRNASISGAEAGCQGEVGSACSMAAAGLAAVLGGTPRQIENAAEIAMEHNLGLTCDPVGGLVQMPCIERNAIAAGTAVAAVRLALAGDGSHKISLDTVIETMRQTGVDMSHKYKETSMGGLAVNVVEC